MKKRLILIGAAIALILGAFAPVSAAMASPKLPNGFTAKVIAYSGQKIHGLIDATGYDVGIYVGPGIAGVRITGATVKNANDEGILVQDTTDVQILGSTVENNALSPAAGLTEVKGIVLAGTTNVLVQGNTVIHNLHGGISVLDDGASANVTFAPKAISPPRAGSGNVIKANYIADNLGDCGIVVSAKNVGGGVDNNVISNNTLSGGVGGIVLGTGFVSASIVSNTVISNNEISGGFLPGIVLHAGNLTHAPGTITGTKILNNVISSNGVGDFSGKTTGIEIFALTVGPPAWGTSVISDTQISKNSIDNDFFGVFKLFDTGTEIDHLQTSNVTVPVAP